jgi:MtaA/CmuA family methyltransferase
MTGLERTRAAIRGQPVDRIPTFPILLAPACQLTGVKQRQYNLDAGIMADTLLEARQLCGFDGIYVSRDNWVYHQALGGKLIFPEDDESYSTEVLLGTIREFRRLQVPDPGSAEGMTILLAAARAVVRAAGDAFYIQANIDTGPFSLGAVLRGTQDFLIDLVTENERDLHEFLSFCAEVVVAYGRAMIRTGVHGIQFGDSTASLVSPELYAKFVLPYQERAVDALKDSGGDLWIHICGRTDHLLHLLRDIPFQGFEVDAKVDMLTARTLLGERIALKGNLDTTFLLQRSQAEVRAACLRILNSGNFRTGVILSPGCGVPRMTPLANLQAMVRACEEYSAETGSAS